MHLADGVEHRFVAGDREALNVVAKAGPLRDHVVDLAVVGVHVDRHQRRFQVLFQMFFNGLGGFLNRQARHVHLAVGAQVDRAVGGNQVFAGNLLLAALIRSA